MALVVETLAAEESSIDECANYNPREVIGALHLKELLTREEESKAFSEKLCKYTPKQLLALLTIGEALQGEQRKEMLALFEKYSGKDLLMLMKFLEVLRNRLGDAEEAERIFRVYNLSDIVKVMTSAERNQERRKKYVETHRAKINAQSARDMKKYRSRKKEKVAVQTNQNAPPE